MDTSKSLLILIFTLVLFACIPGVITGAENITESAGGVNASSSENGTLDIAENMTSVLIPAHVTYTGNSTEETPPLQQNQSSSPSDAAIKKAFTGWYDQGIKALAAEKYQSASEAFAAALRLEKRSEKALIGYARALSELGRDKEALSIYLQVQNMSPDNTTILIPLGREMNAAGSHDAALATLLNATTLFPENPEGWNQLAAAYAGQSRYEEALTAVRKSLQISLNQSEGWGQLGDILSGQGRFFEAVASFEKSITLDPKNVDAWTGLGDTWTALSRYTEAVTAYKAATDIHPEKKEIWLKVAKIYEKLGNMSEASDAYAKGGAGNLTGINASQKDQSVQLTNQTGLQQAVTTGNITEAAEPLTTSEQ